MKQIVLTCLALGLMAGCGGEFSDEATTSSPVTLLTKGAAGTSADTHRLLAFDKTPDKNCVLNHAFASGDVLTVAAGSYRFVTLADADCFGLPAAETTEAIRFDALLTLKPDTPLKAVLASDPAEITYPGTTIYTATLKPATCLLRLTLADAPEGLVLSLKNMPSGLSLSGVYPADVATTPYPLQPGDNLCLPTGTDAVVEYREPGEGSATGTIDLGITFEAGYIYSTRLQWNEGGLFLKSKVEIWNKGDETSGEAS